ncbi:MAG: hypothetical protein QOJ79_175 [Actinomycetota bacterium]|jgi:hypothetical protein|nr:hypothetical protein [Actinomycetota bacterium]
MSNRRTSISVLCIAATASALIAAGAGPAAAEDDNPGCSTGVLPNVVMGSPDVKPGQALGVYLWHGSNGYSLRATHPGHAKVVIAGRLSASNGFSHITKVRLESADNVTLSSDHKTLTFRFTNYGYIDGLNFAADCSKLMRVKIRIDNAVASPRQIKLGKHRSNPTSNPFTIERSKPAPSPSPTPSDTPTATIS